MESSDGSDSNDDVISEATRDLREHALIAYVSLMEKNHNNQMVLPDLLVKLICWVVGEYLGVDEGDEEGVVGGGYDVKSIVEKMVEMIYRPYKCKTCFFLFFFSLN